MQKWRHGDIAQAQEEAAREFHLSATKNLDKAWRFRVLDAQLLVAEGKDGDALDLLKEEMPPSLSNGPLAARRKMVQGLAFGYSQQFEAAEKDLADAENLAGTNQPQLLTDILLSRGIVETDETKYVQAEADFRTALKIARDSNLVSAQPRLLGSLGNVAMWQEHYDEAVDWYKASLQVSQSEGAKDVSAITLGNIGWSYASMGDFENALDYFQRAERTSSKAGLVRGQAEWLISIGEVYHKQGDYARAEPALREALELARKANDEQTTTQSLNNLALISLDVEQTGQAAKYAKEAVDLERAAGDRWGTLYSLEVEGRIESAAGRLPQAEEIFNEIVKDPAAGTSLHWEAQARLGEAYAAAGHRQKAERLFQQSIATIEAARASVKTEEFRLSFLSNAISVYSNYIDFLVSQNRNNEALQVAELSRARTLADGLGFGSASLSFPVRNFHPTQTARALNATIFCYWLGVRHSYVWAIDANRIRLANLPPADEIDPLVESYRHTLAGPRDALKADAATGEKLYSALVASAIPNLHRDTHVVVIPDGSLYQLNFETLIPPDPRPHYFIDDATITEANSLVLLAASASAKPAPAKKLLLVGDPIPVAADFPKLPQAESEMHDIENYFPAANSTILSQASATPESYLSSDPAQFAFIHFVAHGTASRTSPLDSAVILSKQGDSYKLYARDIIRQPLRAELVTISACNGAGERTYSGEGLVGLSWAFLRAGAHDVISALWEVDDNSTTQLMNRLYGELSRGTPPETALRDAKLAMVHSDSVYKKPFYWAPFQIYRGP